MENKPIEEKPKFKFEDLPEDIQSACTAHIEKEIIDKHWPVLLNILSFLYKRQFNNVPQSNSSNLITNDAIHHAASKEKIKKELKEKEKKERENRKREIDFERERGEKERDRENGVTAKIEGAALHSRASLSDEKMQKGKSLLTKISTKELKKKRFTMYKVSGKGGFGSVFLAKNKIMKKNVAIKKLRNDGSKYQVSNIIEVYFLAECHHPNIVEYIKSFEVKSKGQQQIWIEMEFLEGGTLEEAASKYTFSEKHVAYISRECLKGINYLHERGFAHRDLKSSNVMMSVKGDIKLIDFGLCADFSDGPRKKIMGSPYWIPPEMIRNHFHTYPADIWSFGVCILELFLLKPPYPESPIKCMLMAATRGLKDQIPETASADARDFLSSCLTVNPDQRVTSDQLIKHNWIMQENLEEGIEEILYQLFLSNSLQSLGL